MRQYIAVYQVFGSAVCLAIAASRLVRQLSENGEGFTHFGPMCHTMANPSGDVPFAIDGQTMSSVESASESVGGGLPVETILVVAGLAVVAVGVLGLLTYLYSAKSTVDREITEVTAEREAFMAFAERIVGMQVKQPAGAMATPQTIQSFETGPPPVRQVASAFEETVMALPHYRETYGGDVLDQMAIEFDADLVASLNQPGSMSEPVKQGLQRQATEAAARRSDLLTTLEEEREILANAESDLESVLGELQSMNETPLRSRSYDDLRESFGKLGELGDRVSGIAQQRQAVIHEHTRRLTLNGESVTLQEYLYGDSSPTYPVLGATVRVEELIDRARARVSQALWTRA